MAFIASFPWTIYSFVSVGYGGAFWQAVRFTLPSLHLLPTSTTIVPFVCGHTFLFTRRDISSDLLADHCPVGSRWPTCSINVIRLIAACSEMCSSRASRAHSRDDPSGARLRV